MATYKEPLKLRTYQGKGTGLFYVISGAPCPISRADCFSRGFSTRKEAKTFAARITAAWESIDRRASLYTVSKAPCFFPDNGEASRELPSWTTCGELYQTLNNMKA